MRWSCIELEVTQQAEENCNVDSCKSATNSIVVDFLYARRGSILGIVAWMENDEVRPMINFDSSDYLD